MGKNPKLKWILLCAFFLTGQFFLNGSAYADWTVVSPPSAPSVSSNWGLFNIRFPWAVGQDSQNQTGVLLYFAANGHWISATLPNVSTDWALSGLDLTSSSKGWAVGRDIANQKGVLIYFANPVVANVPTVTTTQPSNITPTTATAGGDVTSDGGAPVTAYGVCWDTSPNPVVGGNCTDDGSGTGVFTSSITNLTPGTLYYVVAYATNSIGTGYGSDLTFTTLASTTSSLALSTFKKSTPVSKIAATAASGYGLVWPMVNVTPPDVNSSNWGLSAVHFYSSDTGWAVGQDSANGRGVMLYFSDGSWASVIVPDVSSDWGLSAVHVIWAVGQDSANGRGVILRFSGGVPWTSIVPPDVGSSDWGLSAVRFISPHEAWAVGQDFENETGVLLHFLNGSWASVNPPDVSSNWGLSSVDFSSSNEGWAVGQDITNGTGVLLHYVKMPGEDVGSWTSVSVSPLGVTGNWGLTGIDLITAFSGWAVGQTSDGTNTTGVLLRYTAPRISISPTSLDFKKVEIGAFLEKTVTVKSTGNETLVIGTVTSPSPPFYISTDSCSGQSLAPSRTCKVTYGFLPESVNFFSDSSNIPSNSAQNPVTVTLKGTGVQGTAFNSITNVEITPDNGTFTACDYVDAKPPTFQWTSSGAFTSIGVQFSVNSDFSGVSLKVNGNLKSNSLSIQKSAWKRILLLPGANGGTVYWKVIANKKDRTMVESSVFSFTVGAGPVENPNISPTSKTELPTLTWDNNCNIIFTVWFGNQLDFKTRPLKKLSLSFKIVNPNPVPDTFETTLSTSQWLSIRKLVGDVTGSTIYWYVQSQDGLGRRQNTSVNQFNLSD